MNNAYTQELKKEQIKRILTQQLPEYQIRYNASLATLLNLNLEQFPQLAPYRLDFAICKSNQIVMVFDLFQQGQENNWSHYLDTRKDLWLRLKSIEMKRIHDVQEVMNIRQQFGLPELDLIPTESAASSSLKAVSSYESAPMYYQTETKGFKLSWKTPVAILVLLGLLVYGSTGHLGKKVKQARAQVDVSKPQTAGSTMTVRPGLDIAPPAKDTNAVATGPAAAAPILQKPLVSSSSSEHARQGMSADEFERMIQNQSSTNQELNYKPVYIKGRSAKECAPNNIFDEKAKKCMEDRWENVEQKPAEDARAQPMEVLIY